MIVSRVELTHSFADTVCACACVPESKITELARRVEQQLSDRGGRKPVGGVSVLPHRRDDVQELPVSSAASRLLSLSSHVD